MIDAVNNLLNEYCPLGDHAPVMSWDLVYLHGAKYFHHRSHLSATGPDDFANNRLGMIVEAISPNPSVMTFSDISLRSGTNQVKQGGTMIIYLEKKPRHSEDYERLCQLMRDAYFDNGHAPVVIIGNGAFVDRKLKYPTIHLCVPPFTTHVPGFFVSKVEEEVKKVRELLDEFWGKKMSDILDCYNNFPRFDWLRNQDEQLWIPILAPAKVYSCLLNQPFFFEQVLTLAKKMVTSRKMEESAISLEQKVLEAALAFLEEDKNKPMERKPKHNPDDDFYYGPDLFKSIQGKLKLERPKLRKEEISEILNDHEGVKDTWRPRVKVVDEEKSTKTNRAEKIIQPMCYAFDKGKLSDALKTYL
jgi:hypothetical protein